MLKNEHQVKKKKENVYVLGRLKPNPYLSHTLQAFKDLIDPKSCV